VRIVKLIARGTAFVPMLPLLALTGVVASSLIALSVVDAPGNVFRCLTPSVHASSESHPCFRSIPAADGPRAPDIPEDVLPVEPGQHWDVYRALAGYAPGATYSLYQPVMYIWATSPTLLVTVGSAGDVMFFDAEAAEWMGDLIGEDLSGLPSGDQQFDIAAGAFRYRGRLGPAPVREVRVFQIGREVLFIDATLLPEKLGEIIGADVGGEVGR
jgi:hypothetical protein